MHLMIDIETLDTASTAVIPQVGWCLFEPGIVVPAVEVALDMQEQIDLGRTISADTLKWWMGQPDIARQRVFDPVESLSISEFLTELEASTRGIEIERVWAHGPQFDIAALKSLVGRDLFDFRSIRDTRTLAEWAPDAHKPEPVTKHSAGDDAFAQAMWVTNMWKELS